jgi:hypothetical protein
VGLLRFVRTSASSGCWVFTSTLIRAVRDYFNEVATIRAAVEPTIFDEFPVQAQDAL